MSAIFGLHLWGQEFVSSQDLNAMGLCLTQYGPDGFGIWQQGSIGLGQCQRIVTPEDRFERQPLHSVDGQIVLVSDARLDNRLELADAFRLNSSEIAEMPDSALILNAYERWGEDAPRHLLGDYAFALWDGRQQQLFLARSPLGNRPVYYYHDAARFAFGTMPPALFALPWVPRALALAHWLDTNPCHTLYAGIKKCPSGHWLRVSQQGVDTGQFWQLDMEHRLNYHREDEYVEAFTEQFDRAVARRLRTLDPVGILLSGGLDSSSVAATAAPLLAGRGQLLAAYTQVPSLAFNGPLPPGKYADETPYVEAIAEKFPNLHLNFVRTEGRGFFADLEPLFASLYAPFHNVNNRSWIEAIYAKAQSQGVRLLLSGASGNLSVSWPGTNELPQFLRRRAWRQAWRAAHGQGDNLTHALRTLLGQGVLPLLPSQWRTTLRHLRRGDLRAFTSRQRWPTCFHPDHIQDQHRAYWTRLQFPVVGTERQMRYETLLHAVESDWDIACEARFGVTHVDPTRDQRLVEFCFAVPEEQWRRKGESRSLIRRAMAHRLPSVVLHNPKRGIQAVDWPEEMYAQCAAMQADLARIAQSPLAQHYLDLARIRQLAHDLAQPGWDKPERSFEYMFVLLSGVMFGHFILWIEANLLQSPLGETVR